jgi:hypothetical protein
MSFACGADEIIPDPAAAADAGPSDQRYATPADFDHGDCQTTAPMSTIDPSGIWHLEIDFTDFGTFPGPVRIDEIANGYRGSLFGQLVDEVRFDDSDLFLRRAWDDGNGPRVRAIDACAVLADGGLYGKYASCNEEECFLGTFVGYKVDALDEPVAEGMTLVSEFAGDPAWPTNWITTNVRVLDDVAYLSRYGDGIRIVDLSDPAQPVDIGHSPPEFGDEEIYNDIKLIDGPTGRRYVIAASDTRGAVVIDVTIPSDPVRITSFGTPDTNNGIVNVHTLFIEGTRAYLANSDLAALEIFDLSEPTAPQPLGLFQHPDVSFRGGYLHDLYVDNGRAYLNYWNLGMVIVDTLDDPSNPTIYGVFEDYGEHTSHSNWVTTVGDRVISVHGDEQFGAHVRIVDVDNGSVDFLNTIGEYETRRHVSVHNILAHGDRAYVSYYQDGVRVLDLSDPTDPQEIAHYRTWPGPAPGYGSSFYEGAIGIDLDPGQSTVYVADTHRGLFVLRTD